MTVNRQLTVILGCCMAAMLVLSAIVFNYCLDRFADKKIEQLSETLLAEKKRHLQETVDNAVAVLSTAEFYESAQAAVAKMNFGRKNNDYVFVVDQNGMFWVNSIHPEMVGKIYTDLGNPAERGLVEYVMSSTQADQGDFVGYPASHSPLNRAGVEMIYFKRFNKWNWTIGAGLYGQDIKAVAAKRRDEARSMFLGQNVMFVFGEFLVLMLCLAAGAKALRAKLVDPVCEVLEAAEEMAAGNFQWDVRPKALMEIDRLIDAMRCMQNSFNIALARLETYAVQARLKKRYAAGASAEQGPAVSLPLPPLSSESSETLNVA